MKAREGVAGRLKRCKAEEMGDDENEAWGFVVGVNF
jgi:hypothetical protein